MNTSHVVRIPALTRLAQRISDPVVGQWLLMPAFVWFVGGLFLDGWAHNHGKVDNTFFTPWHAVFYSGYLAVAAVLALLVWAAWQRGEQWQRALSVPLRVALVAAPAFGMAGVADLWWHTVYGFEAGIELLVSPPHLTLATTMALICLAPARSDTVARSAVQRIPAVFSVLCAWSVGTFILQFNHPFGIVWPETSTLGDSGMLVGVAGLVLHAVLTGCVGGYMLSRRFPRGALSFVLVTNALLIALMGDEYRFAVGMLVVGLCMESADAFLLGRFSAAQRAQLRAGGTAALTVLAYVGVIAATTVLQWPLLVCLGLALVAGYIALWCAPMTFS